ncbi:MAG: hypothetical protein Kow00105_19130 [Phycisphaeraceae bacterium]
MIRRIHIHSCVGTACLAAVLIGLSGCQEALFVDGTTRTQYERYQALRGEYRPPRQVTPLGEERPALRQRLAPLDQP